MALSLKLDLRQKQSLVMTPQLMQAIKLLQMSNLELETAIREELERNPLLEQALPEPDGAAPGGDPAPSEAVQSADRPNGDAETATPGEGSADAAAEPDLAGAPAEFADAAGTGDLDPGSEPHLVDEGSWAGTVGGARGGLRGADSDTGDFDAIAAAAARPESLREHVERQILSAGFSPREARIAIYLAGCLEDTGYLTTPTVQIAADLGAAPTAVEGVLARLKRFEPAGIFAENLAECLALQLAERNRLDPVMVAILDNLELLARRDYQRLKRIARIDDEDLADAVAEIRALDPKPGLVFDGATAQPIVPDVFVRPRPDGSWHVELNQDTLPRVLVDRRYHAIASAADPKARPWLTDCLNSANWLVKSLDQRARTILKVASAIVTYQSGFFEDGIDRLRPLTLKTIAETIEMHESTVSRVTANKYLACPRGLFEFKYFFSVGIPATGGGDGVSAEAVRHRIRTMVEGEAAGAVLSDDQIVAALKADGIDIARRTVAKYREQMNIPSSVQRRREKGARSLALARA